MASGNVTKLITVSGLLLEGYLKGIVSERRGTSFFTSPT